MHTVDNTSASRVHCGDVRGDKPTLLPTTKIEYAQDLKFIQPKQVNYPVWSSILSIASLILMTALSTWMFLCLTNPNVNFTSFGFANYQINSSLAAWAWLPFLFTIFGAGVGALFEIYLLVTGTPFVQTRSKATTFIRNIRLLNLAPVSVTIFFAVCCMVITDPGLRLGALYLSGFIGAGLAFALFFSGAPNAVLLTLVGFQALQIILVLTNLPIIGGWVVAALLIGQAMAQMTAFVITAGTPLRSTGFHVTSTFAGICLFAAMVLINSQNPNFSYQVAPSFGTNTLLFWGLVITCMSGLVVTCKCFPKTYNNWRSSFSNAIWTVIYFVLVSAKRFPKPFNLSTVYNKKAPKPIALRPYYTQHPEYLPAGLKVPAAERLEGNVSIFYQLVTKAKKIFALIAIFDHFFPQSNVKTPMTYKKRMEVWSDGSNYWPSMFTKTIFGYSIPGKTLSKAPSTAIKTYKNGQLLAYLAECGVASPLLQSAPESHSGMLMIDLRHLEQYETKPDYQPYGGVAYFKINKQEKCLELVSIIAPRTKNEIFANPDNPVFRQAEDLVIASIYFQIISGKHLAEIHMTYNLVEVSLHNAFDVNGQWNHPIRTALYLHLFSHELAEEITTEHLVQEGAVFNQIFATKYDSLIAHLNDCYTNFEYGSDEDFEKRLNLLSFNSDTNNGRKEILPNACINWEIEYAVIWRRYAEKIVDAIYPNDEAVVSDEYLQCFYQNLLKVVLRGLPARYEYFTTKRGLIRFMADTIHHLVIRHQVYGTTAIRGAMDPRISKVQVPKDMGTTPVDEWRTLAYVALATGRARFTKLMGDFTYLIDGVNSEYQAAMREAFDNLQKDLRNLEVKWNSTAEDKTFNEEFFRAVPSSLHTGPGY